MAAKTTGLEPPMPNNEHPALSSESLASAPAVSPHPLIRFVQTSWRSLLMMAATLLLTAVLVMIVPVDALDQLGNYGYVGLFVLTLLASASIVLPSPAVAAAWIAGRTLDPWLVGIISGVAAGLGEITGYIAGYSGSSLAVNSRFYPRVEGWVKHWGWLAIFLIAALPTPIIDLAGIAAGTLRMPFRLYLVSCIAGKTIRFIGVAWIARLFPEWLLIAGNLLWPTF
jgi:membrane protein YqaA with SNARE-associated domain